MKWFSFLLLTCLLVGCTVTNEYGPYIGRVVDAETKEPIEGAAVLVSFYTQGFSVGGSVSFYADAVETVTDKNGEFIIPEHRIFRLKMLSTWDSDGRFIIFKPGYGCFPKHAKPVFSPNYSLPEKKYITIELQKLGLNRERYENYLFCTPDEEAPNDNKKYTNKLLEEEGEFVHAHHLDRR